jgi:hypothetical protein
MRAADNATKCREAAELEPPAHAGAGTSIWVLNRLTRQLEVDVDHLKMIGNVYSGGRSVFVVF